MIACYTPTTTAEGGEHESKGIQEPQRLFAVREQG